jgi:hypothetical protein
MRALCAAAWNPDAAVDEKGAAGETSPGRTKTDAASGFRAALQRLER